MFIYEALHLLVVTRMGTTIYLWGNRLGIAKNPWMETAFGKKEVKIFQKTGRRAKLAKHPAVVARWDLFRKVRPEATRACTGKEGMDKAVCIVQYMSGALKK
jgi:hypothetical protein